MRFLLAISSLGCLLAIALTTALWGRSAHSTDWLRVNALGGAAVIASSNQHIGAAIVTDARDWTFRDNKIFRYQHRDPINLLDSFSKSAMGFAFDRQGEARVMVFPLWSICVIGSIPPLAFVATRRKMPRKESASIA